MRVRGAICRARAQARTQVRNRDLLAVRLVSHVEHDAWTKAEIQRNFVEGGGGRYVSSQFTQNVPPVKTVPGFFTADVMGKYDISERLSLQLNINNVFDKFYYDQLHFFHVVPGEGRTALLTLNFNS